VTCYNEPVNCQFHIISVMLLASSFRV